MVSRIHGLLLKSNVDYEARQEFFSGIPLVETDAARAAAAEFLTTVETS